MYEICTHFYKLLSTTNNVVSNEYRARGEQIKKLFRFLDNPQQAIEEFERTPNDEDEREVVNTLKESLKSVWSKDIGRTGLRDYLVEKLYSTFEVNTDSKKRFEAINYLITFTSGQKGILKVENGSGFYNKSKTFLTIDQDNILAKKRDLIKNAVCDCGFGEALTNNNITTFFNKVTIFIKSLSEEYGDNELRKLYSSVINDSVFSFDSPLDAFEDTYKYKDVFKEKILSSEIMSTEYIIKHLEADGAPDDISLIKAVSETVNQYVILEEKIKKNITSKLTNTMTMINGAQTRYKELYSKCLPLVKLRVSETLSSEEINPAVLNLALNTASGRILTLDKWSLMFSYYAHLELMEHIMHLQHLSKIRTLVESISNLSL